MSVAAETLPVLLVEAASVKLLPVVPAASRAD
jgi:hypothetical protein